MNEPVKEQRRKWQSLTAVYATMLPHLQKVAREHGYALAVHGSMAHDMDLIAVPWTDEAADAEVMIEALRESIKGVYADRYEGSPFCPMLKPHGRRAWSIYFRDTEEGWGPYLDISVTPKVTA